MNTTVGKKFSLRPHLLIINLAVANLAVLNLAVASSHDGCFTEPLDIIRYHKIHVF